MISEEIQLPIFVKASLFFIGLLAFIAILYIAQGIIVPIVFAVIIAIVLHPVVNFFVRKRIHRVLAIILTLFLTFLFIATFCALLFSQLSHFIDSWPILVDRFTAMLDQSITSISGYFDIKPQKIHEWITKTQSELINTSTAVIGKTLLAL